MSHLSLLVHHLARESRERDRQMRAAWFYRGARLWHGAPNAERAYTLTVQAVRRARAANHRVVSALRAIREAEALIAIGHRTELARVFRRVELAGELAGISLLRRQAG